MTILYLAGLQHAYYGWMAGSEVAPYIFVLEYILSQQVSKFIIGGDYQATENIRQRQGLNHNTPIIAVTANAMKGDREKVCSMNSLAINYDVSDKCCFVVLLTYIFLLQCLAAGMDDYLSKPLNCSLLHQCIAKWTKS